MTITGGSEHYKAGAVEPLELIESQNLPFHLANVVKYAVRVHYYVEHGKRRAATGSNEDSKKALEAIDKAIWYLERYRQITFLNIPTETTAGTLEQAAPAQPKPKW